MYFALSKSLHSHGVAISLMQLKNDVSCFELIFTLHILVGGLNLVCEWIVEGGKVSVFVSWKQVRLFLHISVGVVVLIFEERAVSSDIAMVAKLSDAVVCHFIFKVIPIKLNFTSIS